MSAAIFFWHQFEQHEAMCLSKMRIDFRQKAFIHLKNVVITINEIEALSISDRSWMTSRIEEMSLEFPELISNENPKI
jgi:hypothetical protein